MPPKIKVTKEEIIYKTLNLVRKSGEDGLNARSIASALNCSTQPIFSNFYSLEELQKAVAEKAYDLYTDYLHREVESGKYPKYKALGMAYIRFAKEESQLFKLMFMCDRHGEQFIPTDDFNFSVKLNMEQNGFSEEKAKLFHLEVWTAIHGIATMLATSFLEFDWEFISNIVTDIYQGLRSRFLTEKE